MSAIEQAAALQRQDVRETVNAIIFAWDYYRRTLANETARAGESERAREVVDTLIERLAIIWPETPPYFEYHTDADEAGNEDSYTAPKYALDILEGMAFAIAYHGNRLIIAIDAEARDWLVDETIRADAVFMPGEGYRLAIESRPHHFKRLDQAIRWVCEYLKRKAATA